ncbi:MAG: VIT domain-containing protein, partial [Marinobacter sp.]|nr:VIT domain-containing protein [Marinobacter sp.]
MLSFPDPASLTPLKSVSYCRHRQVRSGRRKAFLEGVSLWLAVLLFLAIQPLYAQAGEAADGTGTLRYLDASGQRPVTATLLHTDYRVTVSGLIADTRLKQTFENTSQQWREGVYVFPLPEHASVYALTMTTGDRVIRGEVRPRQEAKARYEAARDKGQQAARVDQQRPNLFTTHLANIPPGEAVTVELSYQQAVRYQSGQFELRLPTTLTPRYMPGESVADPDRPVQWQAGWARPTSAVPDADAISPFTVKPDDVGARSHRATIELTLNAGLPIGQVTSPSHELTSTWHGDQVSVVPRDGDILMDRDLVVRWSPVRGATPSAAVFHENWQGDDYLLTLLVPGLASQAHLPRELVFVIDTSGSMAGASIRQARASLLRGLATLG